MNGHYFLVGTGVPWFPVTDAPQRTPGGAGFARQDISLGIDFFAPAQRALTKWGDFVLYKDTPTNILVQGRFDNNWKLKGADAEKLAATGAVTVSPVAR